MADYTAESMNETRFVMGAALTAIGGAIGIAGAVAGVIAIVACVASAVPALRAAQVDPLVALRYE